jgi:ketosteroid isomerase-like protein
VIVACAALLVAGCQAPPPAGLTDADKAAIAQGDAGWAQAAEAGDMTALGLLYAEDAVLLPPNHEAITGRAAIEAYFGAFPPLSDVRLDPIDVEGSAGMAYVRGVYTMKINVPNMPVPASDQGKYIEIWKKQADGTWKIVRDIYNSDVSAAGS